MSSSPLSSLSPSPASQQQAEEVIPDSEDAQDARIHSLSPPTPPRPSKRLRLATTTTHNHAHPLSSTSPPPTVRPTSPLKQPSPPRRVDSPTASDQNTPLLPLVPPPSIATNASNTLSRQGVDDQRPLSPPPLPPPPTPVARLAAPALSSTLPSFLTTSQEIAQLEDLDPAAFDWIPSSDPVARNDQEDEDEDERVARPLPRPPPPHHHREHYSTSNGADDSGVFLNSMEIDLENDPELVGGDEVILGDMDDDEVLLDGEAGADDFDGDEMWDGFNDEEEGLGVVRLSQRHVEALEDPDGRGKGKARAEDDIEEEEQEQDYAAPPHDESTEAWAQTTVGTFAFASRKPVVLSEEALRKARALVYNDDGETDGSAPASIPLLPPPTPRAFNSPFLRPSTTRPQSAPLQLSTSATSAFSTAGGTAVAAPSSSAIAQSNRLLSSTSSPPRATSTLAAPTPLRPPAPFVDSSPHLADAMPAFVGFTTGGGAQLAMPSEDALARARGTVVSSPETGRGAASSSKRPSRPTSAAEGTGDVFSAPNGAPRIKPAFKVPLLAGATRSSTPARPRSAVALPSSPLPQPSLAAPRASAVHATPLRLPPPPPRTHTLSFRPPLLHSNSASGSRSSTPVAKGSPAVRRLNLGGSMMTPPRSSASAKKGGGQKVFVTPFKNGVKPEGLATASKTGTKGVGGSKDTVKGKGKALEKVFDLTAHGPRQLLFDASFRPQSNFYEDVRDLGAPDNLLTLDSISSTLYMFDGRGPVEAHAILLDVGCSLAELKWVRNHWSLIVWKRASMVRNAPSLLKDKKWWSFEAIVDQLRYRYEREVHLAQRSCIKRIQERDSPSALPLVLCVSQILWGASSTASDTLAPGEEALLQITGLELTDGWYRIKSNIDAGLKRACERGKIVLGAKLAVVGAKLEGGGKDGMDVLEALGRSSLVISANSTSLAPWHAKLGFLITTSTPVASLESLVSDGGLIAPSLDVVVEKVFPYGYVDLGKGGNRGIWNEEEERTRADDWEKGRAKALARLADEMDKTKGEWDDLIEMLQDATHQTGAAPSASDSDEADTASPEEEPDELLDRLEACTSSNARSSVIGKLSSKQVRACLELAGANALTAREHTRDELEHELTVSFPPRDVRGFRVVRVCDAHSPSQPSMATSGGRTALLTVWDANSLGDTFLLEGKRYQVSKVVPKGTWLRKSREVTLATTRGSVWNKL